MAASFGRNEPFDTPIGPVKPRGPASGYSPVTATSWRNGASRFGSTDVQRYEDVLTTRSAWRGKRG